MVNAKDTIHYRQFGKSDFVSNKNLNEVQLEACNAYMTMGRYLLDHAEEMSKANNEADSSIEISFKVGANNLLEMEQKIKRFVINNKYPEVRED